MAVAQMDVSEIDADLIVAQHGPFVLLANGVVVTGSPTYDQWADVTGWVQKVEKASPFWIGDLLAYGEASYGEKYTQAIEATGHKVGYLMNIASVTQKIPPSRRRPDLSFSHHQEVAPLPDAQQEAWLDRAELENWSAKDLRDQIRITNANAKGHQVEFGVWVRCADEADQTALCTQLTTAGRTVRKTVKEIQ